MNEFQLVSWLLDAPSWALLLGVLAPILTAAVNQPVWSKWARQAVAIVVSVLVGVVGCLADGSITEGMTVLQAVAVVAVASHVAYRTLLHHIAEKVEKATSLDGG